MSKPIDVEFSLQPVSGTNTIPLLRIVCRLFDKALAESSTLRVGRILLYKEIALQERNLRSGIGIAAYTVLVLIAVRNGRPPTRRILRRPEPADGPLTWLKLVPADLAQQPRRVRRYPGDASPRGEEAAHERRNGQCRVFTQATVVILVLQDKAHRRSNVHALGWQSHSQHEQSIPHGLAHAPVLRRKLAAKLPIRTLLAQLLHERSARLRCTRQSKGFQAP